MPNDFKCDVFLSHSAKDTSRRGGMRELANRLKNDKLRLGFEDWELKPGNSQKG